MSDETIKKDKENCPETPVSFSANRSKRHQLFRLQEAFEAINEDRALAKEFVDAPIAVLKRFDVQTTNLKINKGEFGAKRPGINFGGSFSDQLSWTVCASIGFIVCATVGDEV